LRARDIRVGQVFVWSRPPWNDELGVFLLTHVDHDPDHCYVTYKKLWLWSVDRLAIGCLTSGGSPWESDWPHDLVD